MLSGGASFATLIGRTRVFLPGGVAGCWTSADLHRRQRTRHVPHSAPFLAASSYSTCLSSARVRSALGDHSSVYFRQFDLGARIPFSTSSSNSSRGGLGGGGPEDHYATLGLSSTADAKEIKTAFYRLSKQYHPDLNPGDKKAEEKFKAVSAAYNVLGDAVKKRDYDREHAAFSRQSSQSASQPRWTDGARSSSSRSQQNADWSYMDAEQLKREQEVVWRTLREMEAKYGKKAKFRADDFGFGNFDKTARDRSGSSRSSSSSASHEQWQKEQAQRQKEQEEHARIFERYHHQSREYSGAGPRKFSWRNLNLMQFLALWFTVGFILDLFISVFFKPQVYSPYQGRDPYNPYSRGPPRD